jgi:hypothetical protein
MYLLPLVVRISLLMNKINKINKYIIHNFRLCLTVSGKSYEESVNSLLLVFRDTRFINLWRRFIYNKRTDSMFKRTYKNKVGFVNVYQIGHHLPNHYSIHNITAVLRKSRRYHWYENKETKRSKFFFYSLNKKLRTDSSRYMKVLSAELVILVRTIFF